MKSDLEKLEITQRQIENLTGFDVDEVFIGGVFGGVYRPSIFQNPKRLAFFCLTEIFVLILTFIFTIPIGLLAVRNFQDATAQLPIAFRFLEVTLGITLIVVIAWNIYMGVKVKQIKTLAHLLDEVDKYNEVVRAINILDKLEAVEMQNNLTNRSEVIRALNLARDSLICGLMTEKVLRDNRGLLARRYDLFINIENNFIALRALEVNNQANEYRQLLNNAIQIGMSVHEEVQKLSSLSQSEL